MRYTRPNELRMAEWKEFDLQAAVWKIPAERMKMGRAHQVPLPMPVAQLPPRLECEAVKGEYTSSLGFARHLKELELQMEYVPSLDDLDSAQA